MRGHVWIICNNRFSLTLILGAVALVLLALGVGRADAGSHPSSWDWEWKKTNFSKHSVDFSEIFSDGSPKDGIPAIDDPVFRSISEIEDIGPNEPVIALQVNGEDKAYPLRVLMWHEIVNDSIGGIPVTAQF